MLNDLIKIIYIHGGWGDIAIKSWLDLFFFLFTVVETSCTHISILKRQNIHIYIDNILTTNCIIIKYWRQYNLHINENIFTKKQNNKKIIITGNETGFVLFSYNIVLYNIRYLDDGQFDQFFYSFQYAGYGFLNITFQSKRKYSRLYLLFFCIQICR